MISSDLYQALEARMHSIPILDTLRLEVVEFSEGSCKMKLPRLKAFDGIYESIHGGLLMSLADTAACFAVLTKAGADAAVTTTDMNIRFLTACLTDATAEAVVIKLGRSLCPVSVNIYDEPGILVAVAQVTYFRLAGMPAR